jgi:hypothetical protein
MFLRFIRHGEKWYAQTPNGEYAFSERIGLYEWSHDSRNKLIRTDHIGGDRQISSNGELWTIGRPEFSGPKLRGFRAALSPYRLN